MSFISSVPVNAGGPVANALPVAVMQAMGAAGANPTAKLLLPQAVTGAVLVPSYASQTPKSPAKNLPRVTTSQPLSTLAAQLLAQSAESSPEHVALFTPRPHTNPDQAQLPVNNNQQPVPNNQTQPREAAPPAPAAPPQQTANAAAPTTTPPATTVLPFVAPTSTTTVRKPANENNGNSNGPAPSKERAANSSLRGMSAYQTANRVISDKPHYAVEAVG